MLRSKSFWVRLVLTWVFIAVLMSVDIGVFDWQWWTLMAILWIVDVRSYWNGSESNPDNYADGLRLDVLEIIIDEHDKHSRGWHGHYCALLKPQADKAEADVRRRERR